MHAPPTLESYCTNAPKGARSMISMRVPQGSVMYVTVLPVVGLLRTGSSRVMPYASIFFTTAWWSLTSKPMWSSTRPRVGACFVSALANRS